MEELKPEELEELVQELQEESEEEETLSPEVEQLLRELQPARRFTSRLRAARQLGEVSSSSRQIVQTLVSVAETDASDEVRTVAAESLRAPVHQEYLQEYLDQKRAAESTQQQYLNQKRAAEGTQQQPKQLAPSELILLHGDQFARTSSAAVKLWGWVGFNAKEMTLVAAFLAVEQSGAVKLEVRRQQALFGLLVFDKLYVVPGEGAISWPSRSIESELRGIAERLQSKSGKGHNHVSEIVYDWWMGRERYKSRRPWARLGDLVKDGLVSRGLLQKERKPGLKGLFAGESYVLPAETAALATQQSLEPVVELLETCRRNRPEVWRLLIKGINKGISKCEEVKDVWD